MCPTEGSDIEVWRAYVDESESNRRLDPDTYILAAVIVDQDAESEIREAIAPLRPPGQTKLHWHAESDRSRRTIAKIIGELEAFHLVVVRNGRPDERAERRRRKCFEKLAYTLNITYEVRDITAESRERKANERELTYFNTLRAKRLIPSDMRLYHVPGPTEPLLWIADAVAGAVTAHRTGDPQYLEALAHQVDMVILDVEP